jgi:hypothetical protein
MNKLLRRSVVIPLTLSAAVLAALLGFSYPEQVLAMMEGFQPSKRLTLTAAGLDRIAEVEQVYGGALEDLVAELSPAEQEQLQALFARLLAAFVARHADEEDAIAWAREVGGVTTDEASLAMTVSRPSRAPRRHARRVRARTRRTETGAQRVGGHRAGRGPRRGWSCASVGREEHSHGKDGCGAQFACARGSYAWEEA